MSTKKRNILLVGTAAALSFAIASGPASAHVKVDDNNALARGIAIGGFAVGVIALGASILRRRSEGGD